MSILRAVEGEGLEQAHDHLWWMFLFFRRHPFAGVSMRRGRPPPALRTLTAALATVCACSGHDCGTGATATSTNTAALDEADPNPGHCEPWAIAVDFECYSSPGAACDGIACPTEKCVVHERRDPPGFVECKNIALTEPPPGCKIRKQPGRPNLIVCQAASSEADPNPGHCDAWTIAIGKQCYWNGVSACEAASCPWDRCVVHERRDPPGFVECKDTAPTEPPPGCHIQKRPGLPNLIVCEDPSPVERPPGTVR